jgi:voltage-gated potassium channel
VADAVVSPLFRRLRWTGVALLAIVAYGVVGYWALEGWSFLDALYMTIITLTTVGFSEIRPLDDSGRIFTMTLLVMGVGVALVAIALIASVIAEEELGGGTRRRRMRKQLEELHDHFIVCAYGRVGRAAVRELQAADVSLVVLDPKDELRDRMEEDGIPFLVEDPSLEHVLLEAGVDRARGLLCAVDSDATNVYITLTARSMNQGLFIVARASEPGSEKRLERAGADRVVSPFVSSGRHMVRMALDPGIVDVFDEASTRTAAIDVEERVVAPGSPLIDRTVAEVGAPVLAIRGADRRAVASPAADRLICEGDVILLLRERQQAARPTAGSAAWPSAPGTPPR